MGPDGRTTDRPSRRTVLLAAGFGALGLSGVLQAAQAATVDLPRLPAAPASPKAVRATVSAFADTVVPGPAGGASRTAGALEAGVVDELYDPFYALAESFGLLHGDLQLQTPRVLGRRATFALDLPYVDRERVVADRMAELTDGGSNAWATLYQTVGVLVYLSWCSTAQSTAGLQAIGFPSTSDGYAPGHSYGVRLTAATADGNPR